MSDYVTPKTNWTGGDCPLPSDFNRIERNAKANHDAIVAEATARDAAILIESNTRTAGDAVVAASVSSLSGKLGGVGMAWTQYTIGSGTTWTPAAGLWIIMGRNTTNISYSVFIEGEGWTGHPWTEGGMIATRGDNFTLSNSGAYPYDLSVCKIL